MSSTVRASRWLQRLGSSIVSWLTGVSLVLASACAGSEDADRTHGGRASSTDTQSTRLSPRVVSPIDPGPFTENPCRLVPEDKLASDRKSTRLNSSHVKISYAVFCLKKKK